MTLTPEQKGRFGLVAIILGNTAAFIGSIDDVHGFFKTLFGYERLWLLVILAILTIAAGFILGFGWLYQTILSRLTGSRKIVVTVVMLLVVGTGFYANAVLISRQEPLDSKLVGQIPTWCKRLWHIQVPKGGFRIDWRDPSAPPQVWTTAQVLKGMLVACPEVTSHPHQIKLAFDYIETARRQDENEGWGYFEPQLPAVTEIAAWVTLARVESLNVGHIWKGAEQPKVISHIERDLALLIRRQDAKGGWSPIKEVEASLTRTYSTVMATWSLIEAKRNAAITQKIGSRFDTPIRNGIQWLLNHHNSNLGWIPNPHRQFQVKKHLALTAQVLYVLSRAESIVPELPTDAQYRKAKSDFFANAAELGTRDVSADDYISDSDQYLLPTNFQLEGSTFLWWPWTLLTTIELTKDPLLSQSDRETAVLLRSQLMAKADKLFTYVDSGPTYIVAENLFCVFTSLKSMQVGKATS